eukprot:CAMPEP_0179411304 /NCGR_PEP_ID=MMETSP0799-20121207/3825_1 /TAXON_ID=46947 /ORGANISM="Geminigera cryophila, Strain CCMP2564" /LENGTH=102 /DNA_ID=CAMNT_0021183363 /DNA_START=282 /DNA_END=589 /DNA_ORIENTATION=-
MPWLYEVGVRTITKEGNNCTSAPSHARVAQQNCADVLPAPDVELLRHGSQGPGPPVALYEPARHAAHVKFNPAKPGLHAHAARDSAPASELAFGEHGVAVVV